MSEGHTERLDAALTGRYRIERKLGEGGMAAVYLAEDVKHSRKVALKILRPELAAVIGAERFLSEIRTTANLQHPHILPLCGFFPLWSPDGSELFYLQPGAPVHLISASVDTGATFAFRGREVVLGWPYFTGGALGRTYDVSPDGERFLAVKVLDTAGGGAAPEITVVLNWFEEIRQRMGN